MNRFNHYPSVISTMFPYEIRDLNKEENRELLSVFEGERTGFCQVGPQKWLLPAAYAKHAEGYYSMPLRQDDIWVVTYPRSGTTFCQELVWLVNNNFDYKRSAEQSLGRRFPFYEFGILHHEELHKEVIAYNNNRPEVVRQLAQWREPGYIWGPEMKSPRHLKTHLPLSLLPPDLLQTCKVIYVARNPKDVAVSYYHHNRLLKVHDFTGDFKSYWNYFKRDLLDYSPYWEHVLEAWDRRHDQNLLFVFYENLVKDTRNEINKIAKFLGKTVSENQMEKLLQHLEIDNFRKEVMVHENIPIKGMVNEGEQGFIRKGKVGDHKEFTPELFKDADEWIEKYLSTTSLQFPI